MHIGPPVMSSLFSLIPPFCADTFFLIFLFALSLVENDYEPSGVVGVFEKRDAGEKQSLRKK